MFYWKIVVDKECHLPPQMMTGATTTMTTTDVNDNHLLENPSAPLEPFHSLIKVAKKYVNSVKISNVVELDNANTMDEFRIPDHYEDEEQEKFYKFYDNYVAELANSPEPTVNDVYSQFSQKTYQAVEKYGKTKMYNEKTIVDENQNNIGGAKNEVNQSFMKKRVQRMGLVPLSELADIRQYSSSVNDM